MWRLRISEGKEEKWVKSRNEHVGRQYWEFDPNHKPNFSHLISKARLLFHSNRFTQKNSSDLLMRFQFASQDYGDDDDDDDHHHEDIRGDDDVASPELVERALIKGVTMFSKLQTEDGFWPADYGGPLFLLPSLVIGLYVTRSLNTILTHQHKIEMCRYMYNHQNEDGGWGLHIEGKSIMFSTALSYVALRLLDETSDKKEVQNARQWILRHGGAVTIPSWGKMWLSVLGVYEWNGNNPVPPELWLLPYAFNPIHPGRMWCHSRMVYLPISYLYALRFVGPITDLVLSLRAELYNLNYDCIDWEAARNLCNYHDLYKEDAFSMLLQRLLWGCLHYVGEPFFTKWPFNKLRKKALNIVMQYIHAEDCHTNYICLGPVNKVLNMICCWAEDPNSEAFTHHLSRVKDYLWVAEDGMKMQGYNGSQLWDASLAAQALLSSPDTILRLPCVSSMLHKANFFIKNTQIHTNFTDPGSYRHISKGGWTFSTPDNAWAVSDCTATALHTTLLLSSQPKIVGDPMPRSQVFDSLNLLLSLQNPNGGFASYELTRSYAWLESLNPVQVFADIMIDYQYVECTSAVVQALVTFTKTNPNHRTKDTKACIAKAVEFIESVQKEDGSWYGSWGVCYTYATWFAINALVSAGKTFETSRGLRMACRFLLSKQLLDSGGWGESYLSCHNEVYTNLEGNKPHLVNTSWAMLGLIKAGQGERDSNPLHRAAKLLMKSQMKNGEFPQQEISGVFNKTCMISYSNYRNIFPIWALGEYFNRVLKPETSSD